ncbi:sensor histidine kinase [Nocardioides sp. KR10-350]|uniref:sensor histidine kinase n=1 Tax=Nocardioides cheoyonin TaxID=3156615 RepID=UPI0032B5A790
MAPDRLHLRVTAAARVFVLAALLVPVLWARDMAALLALLAIATVWAVATAAELRPRNVSGSLTVLEAIGVGAVCGASLDHTQAILGALVVPVFVAGIYEGVAGLLRALSGETVALAAVLLAAWRSPDANDMTSLFSWLLTALGLGLIGAFVHGLLGRAADPLAPYHHAQGLLRRLISISDGLDSGLDPVGLGGDILTTVGNDLPTTSLALYVPRDNTLTPLLTRSLGNEQLGVCEEVALTSWDAGLAMVSGRYFAFPLRTEAGLVAVVVGALSSRSQPEDVDLSGTIKRLGDRLKDRAVHLDTALLFAAFRDSATTEERRRLAREMHDGMAQDLASLGYLVDALSAGGPVDPARLHVVRERISAIVTEVRRSLVNLRTSVAPGESLGAALSSVARSLSEVSGVPIHVTLDEHTDRLRPEIEGELLRIAQEAMNNAVKHARASGIDVHCQVRAPAARITVKDDGQGFQGPRRGSHGLSIMRERARLIGADLDLGPTPGGGFTVTVSLPAPRVDSAGARIPSYQGADS